MKKRILIVTNHSYMFWQFRKELVEALQKEHEVILAMPFVGHEEDFRKMGIECIPVSMNRRGVNPFAEAKLLRDYKRLLQKISPDFVLTYSIKPNIYMGLLCSCKKIPYYANVQGLGTAFQKPVLAGFVTVLYRIAFRKVKYVFFENKENAREFGERNIVSADRQVVLPGAGINLEKYKMEPYPNHSRVHFLYLGRIMKEKGIEELFYAVRRLKEENEDFVLDLAGFFEDIYKKQVEELEQLGIAHFYGFQSDPRPFYTEADCVVLPSYHEGMSNVLLEAAATGRPVITSNIPGCRESVENGKSGLLVEAKKQRDAVPGNEKDAALQQRRTGKNGKSRKRENEKRVSEGSCGGQNGEESGVKTGKDKSDWKLMREMGFGEKAKRMIESSL